MKRLFCFVLLSTALLAISALSAHVASAQVDAKFQIPDSDDGLPGAGPIRPVDSCQRKPSFLLKYAISECKPSLAFYPEVGYGREKESMR